MCAKCDELRDAMKSNREAIRLMLADGTLVLTVGIDGSLTVHTDDLGLIRGGASALVEGMQQAARELDALETRQGLLQMALGALISRLPAGEPLAEAVHEAKELPDAKLTFAQPAPKGGRKS